MRAANMNTPCSASSLRAASSKRKMSDAMQEIPASAEYLHTPDMLHRLRSAESHMSTASALARMLWLALSEGISTNDERDRQALIVLASEIADHSSAAEVALELEQSNRR